MVTSAKKVVLLQLGKDWDGVSEVLTDPHPRGPAPPTGGSHFQVNVRDHVATKGTYLLCLVASGTLLVALGLIRSQGRSGDLDILVRIDDVIRLHRPVDLADVAGHLPPRLASLARRDLTRTATIGDRTAEALLRSLQNLSGEAGEALAFLRNRISELGDPRGRSQATAELHDALTLGLRLAGFPRGTLTSQRPPIDTEPANYFALLEAEE